MIDKQALLTAIIPARGGSKGIPRKNLQMLAGKPLIGWIIEAAKAARYVNRIIVSTDDQEIAAVSCQFGAEVIMRPAELSGDLASSEGALLHVLESLEQAGEVLPESLVFLQCTSPLTLAADIDGTVQVFIDGDADTALAVSDFHYFLWRKDEQGDAVGVNHDKAFRPLRQQRAAEYIETGSVYVMDTQQFIKHRHRFFGKTALYEMPAERCWEIDSPLDLSVAEPLLREQLKAAKATQLPVRVEALALDFDGVITDNRVLVLENGQEAVFCSRSDGWGIGRLRAAGVAVVVVSTEKNPVVAARCAKLEIDCLQGLDDKIGALQSWAEKRQVDLDKTVFVGNDVNDIECLQSVGCPVVVADAHPSVRPIAKIILESRGGDDAVREVSELILKSMVL